MMDAVIYAFYMTMELWIFLGILMLALVVDEIRQRRYNTNINSN
jgi:hypothetical protein